MFKYCEYCKDYFDTTNTEHWAPTPDGYFQCKPRKYIMMKKWREEHREEIKTYNKTQHKKYYEENKEQVLKECAKYRKENKEKIKNRDKKYRETHKEKIKKFRKDWFQKHKKQVSERRTKRKKDDINFRLGISLRARLGTFLKRNKIKEKSGSAVKDLGCTVNELKQYLESQFYPNPRTGEDMTWDNYGKTTWHIDHIIPLASFDLTDRDQFLKACHYTNLQPMWAEENWSKQDKVIETAKCLNY